MPRPATEAEPDRRLSKAPPRIRISGPSWSDLLKRCFDVDGWACPLWWGAHEATGHRHRAPGDDSGAERVEIARAACAVSGRVYGELDG